MNKKWQTTPSSLRLGIIMLVLLFSMTACGGDITGSDQVKFVSAWGANGNEDGQFLYIEDFDFSQDGNLFVTDALKKDVQVFTKDGQFLAVFGTDAIDEAALEKPEGVAVDSSGNIFIGDYLSGYIQKYDSDHNHLLTFSGFGRQEGLTAEAEFMSAGLNDLIYVAEAGNNRNSVFNQDGEFQFAVPKLGQALGDSDTLANKSEIWERPCCAIKREIA